MGRAQGLRFFVPGLGPEVSDEDLQVHFSKFGQTLEAAVARDRGSNASRGFGYVTMADEACRDLLLNSVHLIGGREIRLVLTKDSLVGYESCKVHVNNIENVSADEIRDAFSKFGQVLDVHTPKNSGTGEKMRFGFVTFGSDEAFQQALGTGSVMIGEIRIDIRPAAQQAGGGEAAGKGKGWGWGWDGGCGGKGWGGPESWGGAWGWGGWGGCGEAWGAAKPPPGRPDFWSNDDGVRYYIPGLAPEVVESNLLEHFAQYGKVLDAIVVREKGNDSSRGFGYVKMADDSSRNQMISDKHSICGKEVAVMLSKESLIGANVKKVHIDDCMTLSPEAIREAFAHFGPVLDIHTPKDHMTGERKKFAFVTFGTDEALAAAINAGSIMVGDVTVPIRAATHNRMAEEGKGRGGGAEGPGGKHLPGRPDFWNADDGGLRYYVPGLAPETTEQDVLQHFAAYGQVLDAIVVKEKGSELSRGFGYVKMADASSMNQMLSDKHTIRGMEVSVMLSKESLTGGDLKKVHVDECEHLSAGDIRDAFAQFGPVLDVHTPKDHRTGERKKFGFVTFATEGAMQAAIAAGSIMVNGAQLPIKPAAQNTFQEGGKGCKSAGKGGWGGWGCGGWGDPSGYDYGPWGFDYGGKGYGKDAWGGWGGWGGGCGWGQGAWGCSGKGCWDSAWGGGKGGKGCWGKGGGKDYYGAQYYGMGCSKGRSAPY